MPNNYIGTQTKGIYYIHSPESFCSQNINTIMTLRLFSGPSDHCPDDTTLDSPYFLNTPWMIDHQRLRKFCT